MNSKDIIQKDKIHTHSLKQKETSQNTHIINSTTQETKRKRHKSTTSKIQASQIQYAQFKHTKYKIQNTNIQKDRKSGNQKPQEPKFQNTEYNIQITFQNDKMQHQQLQRNSIQQATNTPETQIS